MGVTLSNSSSEMVVNCFGTEYDYYYVTSRAKQIISILAKAIRRAANYELLVAIVEGKSVSSYATSKKEKANNPKFTRMPAESELAKSWLNERASISHEPIIEQVTRKSTLYSSSKEFEEVSLEDFEVEKVIGRGSYGKVCMVRFKPTKEVFAMKSLKKDILLDNEQITSTILEKKILENMSHPFLCSLKFCFQTEERVYFVMPFMEGGELFQHLRKFRVFSEEK